jgi:recombination protein RecR
LEINPSNTTDSVNKLMHEFSKLPGIGPKSAQRLTYYLLRAPQEQVSAFAEAVTCLKSKTCLCTACYNVADSDLCPICKKQQPG